MADLLLVDNDERIAELVGWFLERRGHQVRIAASYALARRRIAEDRPDLMLADLELGSERGTEELPRLAAAGLLPRTLVVSGYLDAELERELRAIPGVLDTLAKPFDLGVLEERIALALEAPAPAALELERQREEAQGDHEDDEDDDEGWIEITPGGGAAR